MPQSEDGMLIHWCAPTQNPQSTKDPYSDNFKNIPKVENVIKMVRNGHQFTALKIAKELSMNGIHAVRLILTKDLNIKDSLCPNSAERSQCKQKMRK
jgi:hypothetical protein